MSESKFMQLLQLNVNDKTEKRKSGSTELTYLSWSFAWSEFKKVYPEATYKIQKFDYDINGRKYTLPYMFDPETGYMAMTEVTAEGLTYEMWLPVMDGSNKAMRETPYKYSTKSGGEKTVEKATMFDINKTIMRCLVKNLAMFGLGLYIYAGEDLPEVIEDEKTIAAKNVMLVAEIEECNDEKQLGVIYKKNKDFICKTPELLDLITKKGKELKGAA
jgi:hypothetical protein